MAPKSLNPIRVERVFQTLGNRDRLVVLPTEGDDGERPLRPQLPRAAHLEVELDGGAADAADADLGLQLLVQPRGRAQVELKTHARQPDVERLPQRGIRKSRRAEQLGLGELDQARIRVPADQAAHVDVAPAHVLAHAKGAQRIVTPPSATITWPVMKAAASEARKAAMPPMSRGSPSLRSGVLAMRSSARFWSSHRARANSVLISPGAMTLTRTFFGPHSAARLRTRWWPAA